MGKILFVHNMYGFEHPSLSIEYLSAYLKSKGHKAVLIIDFNDRFFRQRLELRIRQERPDLIGFSVLTPLYNWAISVARYVKKISHISVVFGNIHPTLIPEAVLTNNCVDFVVRGEGECTLAGLMKSIDDKSGDYKKIKNLCYKTERGVVCNPLAELIEDLDSLPYPDKEITLSQIPFSRDIYYCLTERGCPYSCNFCHNQIMKEIYCGKGTWVRRRGARNVIEELLTAKERGYRFVHFDDDCFINDDAWLEDFLNSYRKYIKLPFQINIRFRYIKKETALLLSDAGCLSVKGGIQTTSDRLLREVCNRVPDSNIFEATRELKGKKIIVKIDTMVNLPTQSQEDIIKDILFYNRLRPDLIVVFNLIYFPRSKITDFARSSGFIKVEEEPKLYEEGLGADYIKDKALLGFIEFVPHLPAWFVTLCIKKRVWNIAYRVLCMIYVFVKLPYYLSSRKRLLLSWLHIKKSFCLKLHLLRISRVNYSSKVAN